MSKLIVISAPSGTGKSTVVKYLQEQAKDLHLQFSISATCRAPRGEEKNGVEYYFLTHDEFLRGIKQGEFVEYQEVYPGRYYGTLRKEVDRLLAKGENIIFDVDCEGGLNIKKIYGAKALIIFLKPPCIEELRDRLIHRGTDSIEVIQERLNKAEKEIERSKDFDYVVLNDDLSVCCQEVERIVRHFIETP